MLDDATNKTRLITLLIEDRRHGADELAQVHVPLKTAGEGLWADAKDVCVALQSGLSRIDAIRLCVYAYAAASDEIKLTD